MGSAINIKVTVVLALLLAAQTSWASFERDMKPFSIIHGTIDGATIVNDLPPTSALSKLGVKKGDVLLTFDNELVVNRVTAKKAYEAKSISAVRVLRNHRTVTLRSRV